VVYAAEDTGKSVVAAMDPMAALELTGNAQIQSVAQEARTRLERVLAALQQ
jgi:uncharacterized protein (DUF302 family)